MGRSGKKAPAFCIGWRAAIGSSCISASSIVAHVPPMRVCGMRLPRQPVCAAMGSIFIVSSRWPPCGYADCAFVCSRCATTGSSLLTICAAVGRLAGSGSTHSYHRSTTACGQSSGALQRVHPRSGHDASRPIPYPDGTDITCPPYRTSSDRLGPTNLSITSFAAHTSQHSDGPTTDRNLPAAH